MNNINFVCFVFFFGWLKGKAISQNFKLPINPILSFTYEGKDYRFYGELLTWMEANAACLNKKSKLVAINDVALQPFIDDAIQQIAGIFSVDRYAGLWTAGRRLDDGNWVWTGDRSPIPSAGSDIDNGNWVEIEQDVDAECLMLVGRNNLPNPVGGRLQGTRGKWLAQPCEEEKFFVCEESLQCLPNPCDNGGVCFPGSTSHICKCSKYFTGQNCTDPIFIDYGSGCLVHASHSSMQGRSFDDGLLDCQLMNSSLAVPRNSTTAVLLDIEAVKMDSEVIENFWLGVTNSSQGIRSLDGFNFSVNQLWLEPGMPVVPRSCLSVHVYEPWSISFMDCSLPFGYLCEKPALGYNPCQPDPCLNDEVCRIVGCSFTCTRATGSCDSVQENLIVTIGVPVAVVVFVAGVVTIVACVVVSNRKQRLSAKQQNPSSAVATYQSCNHTLEADAYEEFGNHFTLPVTAKSSGVMPVQVGAYEEFGNGNAGFEADLVTDDNAYEEICVGQPVEMKSASSAHTNELAVATYGENNTSEIDGYDDVEISSQQTPYLPRISSARGNSYEEISIPTSHVHEANGHTESKKPEGNNGTSMMSEVGVYGGAGTN